MESIIKTIKTVAAFYVYDRSTNSVLRISEDEFNELESVENKLMLESESHTLARYKSKGYFKQNQVETIEHPYTCMVDHILNNHIEQLTIQVTQRCNLRCQYCTYSGIYDDNNRTHADYDMSYETAKKAIDFYLNRSMESDELIFGFYGGEPLLKFELIEKCVNYINETVQNKKINYTITTNGTLLTKKIAEFLFLNNFSIVISLDGSKQEHDQYRVFPNGTGSFDTVMRNLYSIREAFPSDFKKIRFNTVLNPKNDYKHLKLYFEEDELVGESDVMTTLVDNKSAEGVKFGDEFYRARAYEQFKLYLYMLKKVDLSNVSKLVISNYAFIKQKYQMLVNHRILGCKAHHGGPCIPGGKRLFINVFGKLYPCERVAEESEVMHIGTLETGFDFEKAKVLLNVGKVTEEECRHCWALDYCSICCQKADDGNKLSKKKKTPYCAVSKSNAYSDIAEICVLRELGCTFAEKGLGIYEKDDLPS